MPTVLTFKEWRFLFYSNEGSPREPRHIHAVGHGKEAKFWLEPVALADYVRCNSRELRELLEQVEQNKQLFIGAWDAHFTD